MPDAKIKTGPDLASRLTPEALAQMGDSYIIILATLAEPAIRRQAALVAVERKLELAAWPPRHRAILDEALHPHVHVREREAA